MFRTGDDTPVIISGHPAEKGTFAQFLQAFEIPEVADDPRFADVASRVANGAELKQVLLDAATRIPDWPTFEARSSGVGLAVGRVLSGRDLAESDWAAERGAISEVSDRAGGTIRIPNPPWHFSDAEVGLRGGPKYRGEDNREVLAELLGYDDATIDGLEADGVLSSRVPSQRMSLHWPVVPMRATLGQLPAEDDGWAYEIKWDGYRTIAFVEGGKVRLQSSNSIDVSARYPELQPLAAELGGQRAILDGELVVLDGRGRPRFELIQRKEMDHLEAAYFVFDVLAIDRHDTVALPYEERRRLLRELLDDGPNWQVPAHRIGDGRALLDATIAQELEGVMAKRLGTSYRPGARSKDWRKVKNRQQADVVIGGYSPGTGNRSNTFGSLLVGRWDGDRLAFAGGVGTGFTQRRLEELKARFDALRTADCPFDPPPPTAYRRGAVWIRPELVAHVELTEFTNEGYVRQSSFIDLVE